MANKTNKVKKPIAGNASSAQKVSVPAERKPFYTSFRVQALLLAIVGFIFYSNTFSHEYAFDDTMVIVDNEYVQQGVTGIHDIITHDAYQSYMEQKNASNQLAGGRYRPLSLVTFAIEQQFMTIAHEGETTNDKEARIATEMHGRHVINVLLYILSVIALLYFFRQIVFPASHVAAFVAALLFMIHPLHTEVVANVKSRDEILSVLFITLTFIKSFRYRQSGKLRDMLLAMLCLFLALLSKEYGVMLIVLLPLSFYMFGKASAGKSIKAALPYLVPLGLYLLLRLSAVAGIAEGAEKNVLNNPYLYATGMQKAATEILVLFNYIKLLFVPYPLIADYSYNQIKYTDFANPQVWASLVLYAGLIIVMFRMLVKRHVLAFALAFYLFHLLLVSNLFFNIGAPMGERLVYHSSIGFCIAIAWLLNRGYEKINRPVVLVALMACLVVVCGFETITRNRDWKNDETLFLTDVKKAPNSVLINNDAAAVCMNLAKHAKGAERKEWFTNATGYFDKAIMILPQDYLAYQNRGLCYFDMGMPDRAVTDWDTVRKYNPQQVNLVKYMNIAGKYYISRGLKYTKNNQLDSAIAQFTSATNADSAIVDGWVLLGKAYLMKKDQLHGKAALDKAEQLAPGNAEIKGLLQSISGAQYQENKR